MPLPRFSRLLLALLLATSIPLSVRAAGADAPPKYSLREHYTKYEFRIPMRDGVRLFTAVYVPKNSASTYPFLIQRTPYSAGVSAQGELHYGVDYYPEQIGPSREFENAGYIFVKQDVRGRYMSEGKWQEMTPHAKRDRAPGEGNESEDMHDTVEWLLKHVAGNNGKVGILGTSYPGFYTSASIIDSHPAIKAASPQAPVTDLYMNDDSYHGGAFMLAANFDFYAAFTEAKNPTPLPKTWNNFDYGVADGYDFFLKHLTLSNITATMTDQQRALLLPTIEHSTYDEFWQSRDISRHLKNIKAAVLTVGGWYDAEDLQGPLTTYSAIKRNNPATYSGLVMGPWSHGAWNRADGKSLGYVKFDSRTGDYFRTNILFPFFEQHLKGVSNKGAAEVYAFETGTNVWRTLPAWPPQQAQARTLYFGADGSLGWKQPSGAAAYDEYVSDPRKPVPYTAYPATGVPKEYMTGDQRFAASRPDVLTYTSEVLEQDVTVAGPVRPRLFVSTTGTDADWVVKLIDVYPADYPSAGGDDEERPGDVPPPRLTMANYQQLVRGDPIRGKFRHGFEKPQPFTPGKVEAVNYSMSDVYHTFRRGHRIMVQVQSSWFPLVDLNPQTFVDIPKANPEDFQKATQRVYHAPATASGVEVLVLPTP